MNMLLRSSSSPILNSWLSQYSKDSSPEPEFQASHKTRSISLSNYIDEQTRKIINPALSDLNIHNETPKHQKSKKTIIQTQPFLAKQHRKENDQDKLDAKPSSSSLSTVGILFSSSGLGEKAAESDEDCDMQTLVVGGGMGADGGKICNGGGGNGGSGGSDGGGSGFFDNNGQGSDSTDAYYQKMMEANPGNALLLGNYAKFLKEVRGNISKAEKYFERSILAEPNDGNILSLYADLIWQSQKDAQKAESYFGQAVRTASDDCYVLASYARFLWDVEEDNEGEEKIEERVKREHEIGHGHDHLPPNIFHGAPHHSPVTATS